MRLWTFVVSFGLLRMDLEFYIEFWSSSDSFGVM